MLEKTGWQLTHYLQVAKKQLAEILAGEQSTSELIGLTISSYYIKLLKIIPSGPYYRVENFNLVPVPAGMIVKNEIKDPDALAKLIRKLFLESRLTNRNIVFCVPRSRVIMKNIAVNNQLTADEVESKVWIEANRLFPNLVGDIYLDFFVTGPSAQNAAQQDVLVVACRKEFINPYLETLQQACLNTSIIDINYFAYERVLALIAKQSQDIKTIALLNISFDYIDLIVMQEGNAIFTHETTYDGSGLKQICQPSIEKTKITTILNLVLEMQIKHTMQFFYSSRPNVRLERIILSGDCVMDIPELLPYVQAEIGKEVVLANPFKNMTFSSQVDKETLGRHSPALVLCCGVALRRYVI